MKKIISLVVMATMLCTLFAVNVSAAVATGEVTTELVPTYTFDALVDGWTALSSYHGDDYTGTSEIKEDAALGNVLSITPQGKGQSFGSMIGHLDVENALVMPSKYEISFKVKLTSAEGGFMVWIRDIGAHYGIGAGCFETNDWYEMKISIDKTSGSVAKTLMMRNITDNGTWTACPTTGEFTTGRWITSWQTDIYPRARMAAGIAFINHFGSNQNYEYLFDDFAIKGTSTIPVTGVTLAQDYEGNGTAFTRFQNSTGSASVYNDNGNNVYAVTANGSGYVELLATTASSSNSWTGELADTLATNSVIQFDICAKSDDKAPISVEFCQSGNYVYFDLPALPKKDTWYTYKVTQTNPHGANSSAVVVRREAGTNEWVSLENGPDFKYTAQGWGRSGIKQEMRITQNYNGGMSAGSIFWLDNITLSGVESYSYVADCKDNALTVNVSHDKAKEMLLTTQRAVMLATFADGILVDVDYQAVANDGGTVAAELEASTLGANKAELYVWEVETGRPVMTNALNLTSYLAQ